MFYYEKFRNLRKSQKVSTVYLAHKLDISQSTISMWESGKRNPAEKAIRKLADILEVSVQQISDLRDEKIEKTLPPKDLSHFGKTWIDFSTDEGDKQLIDYISAMNKLRQINNDINQATVVIKALMSSFHSAYYVKDMDNRYLTANYAFMDLIKKDREFVVAGRDDFALLPNTEAERNVEEDETVLLTKKPIIKEKRTIFKTRKDKKTGLISKIPVFDRKGRTIGLVGVFTDITKIENKNKENQLLRNCIEQTPYVVWFGFSSNGTFSNLKTQFINSNVENLLGIQHDEYLRNPACNNSIVIDSHKKMHLEYLHSYSFPKSLEYKINHPEKGIRWIESSTFKEDNTFFGIIRDITEKKKRTEQLEKINTILSNTKTGIVIKKENMIVDANQAAASLYEATIEELKNVPLLWWNSIYEDDKHGKNDPVGIISDALNKNKKRINLNYRIKTKTGKIKHIEESLYSTIIEDEEYWCCELKDVTEKIEHQNVRELLEAVVNDLPEQIWITAGKDYQFINKSTEKVYGITNDELLADTEAWLKKIHPEDKEMVEKWKASGYPKGGINYRVIMPDKSINYVNDRTKNINWNGINVWYGVVSIIRNIREIEI